MQIKYIRTQMVTGAMRNKENREQWAGAAILMTVVQEGIAKVIVEQRPKGDQGLSHADF